MKSIKTTEKQSIKTIDNKFYEQIGRALCKRRIDVDRSQRSVSRDAGISRSQYDHYELGKSKIKPYMFNLICNSLGLDSDFEVEIHLKTKN